MHTRRDTANRLIAALWFWLPPVAFAVALSAFRIFVRKGEAYFGPMGTVLFVAMIAGALCTANALGFLAAAFLSPRIQRQHAIRLYAFSIAAGFACYYALFHPPRPLESLLQSAFRGQEELGYLAIILVAFVLSGVISFVCLRTTIALGLLRRMNPPTVCSKCGYDLRGSPGPTCPECGARG